MTNPVSRASVPAGVDVHVVLDNPASDSGGLGRGSLWYLASAVRREISRSAGPLHPFRDPSVVGQPLVERR